MEQSGVVTAEQLNAVLANGGVVLVGSYTRTTRFARQHAGMFFEGRHGHLCVRRGRSSDRLSLARQADGSRVLLVNIIVHGAAPSTSEG